MRELSGRVAVITGAGGGIGLATGKALARLGTKVVLVDVDENRLDAAVKTAADEGLGISAIAGDVSSFTSMQEVAESVYRDHGAVHILHLNAGIGSGASFLDDAAEPWVKTIEVNLLGVVWGIKAFVLRMIEGGDEGVVLATSSGAGAEGTSYKSPAYAATKNAVVSVMESLYGQLRDQQSKIRVGLVFPPLTATNLSGNPETMKFVESHLQSAGVPVVLVQPEEVAEMIVDGIQSARFFVRMGRREDESFFGGVHSDRYFDWSDRIIRGRAEQQLADGKPDSYLW